MPEPKKPLTARECKQAAHEAESKRVWAILGNLPEEEDVGDTFEKP